MQSNVSEHKCTKMKQICRGYFSKVFLQTDAKGVTSGVIHLLA